ncbi:cbb3-type cytochrome oxidase assembly protein CcoS [SAR92 clade bacterium H455]|uniref:Cbb3-type cytochrome oxidase assembly protein CcoS n=1 Tax=SAR92 clade bacterium H455 TaxID=2974818 RepID=A0ABY5TLN5_9GAMM|nr:cbb3-type cytochrome oxidase assembly protein CcoS [SAR92 clade bacterium H455]
MESLYLLIPISLVFIAIAIKLFFWAVKSGQYDDLDSEGERILFDREGLSFKDSVKDSDEQILPLKNKRDKPL